MAGEAQYVAKVNYVLDNHPERIRIVTRHGNASDKPWESDSTEKVRYAVDRLVLADRVVCESQSHSHQADSRTNSDGLGTVGSPWAEPSQRSSKLADLRKLTCKCRPAVTQAQTCAYIDG